MHIHPIEMPMPGMMGTVICYLVVCGSRAALIDTGMATNASIVALETKLSQYNVSIKSLEKVVCTHYHPDHCGLAKYIQSEGVEVVMSAADAAAIIKYFDSPRFDAERAVFYNEHEVPSDFGDRVAPTFSYLRTLHERFVPNGIIEDGQHLDLAGESFEVFVTSGHTDGHVCLLHRSSNTLITGDHILKDSAVHIALGRESEFPSPLAMYMSALERIISLGSLIGLSAHGKIVEDTASRSRELFRIHEERIQQVANALSRTRTGAYVIGEQAFGVKRRPFSKWLCTAQAISCLEYLEFTGRAESTTNGNKIMYSLV